MQDSHTPAPNDETAAADRDRLWLVGATALGLDERLAGRLDGHLARFAEHMREGLLAASVAVGLEVMGELMAAEVTDLARLILGDAGPVADLSANKPLATGPLTD
jgi:hypothetical protein